MTEATQVHGVLDSHGESAPSRQSVYVYEAPVRLWHWVNAAAIVVLATTGYFIGSPPPSHARRGELAIPDGLHPLRAFLGGLCARRRAADAHLLGLRRQSTMRGRFSTCRLGPQTGAGACCTSCAGISSW